MSKADTALVDEFKKTVLDPWCFFSGQVDDADVRHEQDKPANGWHIHPNVDGCEPGREPEPVK